MFLYVSSWLINISKICSHPLIPKRKKMKRSSNIRIGLAKDVNGTEQHTWVAMGLASCTSALAFSAALRILSACGADQLAEHV